LCDVVEITEEQAIFPWFECRTGCLTGTTTKNVLRCIIPSNSSKTKQPSVGHAAKVKYVPKRGLGKQPVIKKTKNVKQKQYTIKPKALISKCKPTAKAKPTKKPPPQTDHITKAKPTKKPPAHTVDATKAKPTKKPTANTEDDPNLFFFDANAFEENELPTNNDSNSTESTEADPFKCVICNSGIPKTTKKCKACNNYIHHMCINELLSVLNEPELDLGEFYCCVECIQKVQSV
jgi:hypothetical protein